MAAATNTPGVRASIVLSSAMPTVAVTEPPTMKRFQRPVAETSRPTTSEQTPRPATIGMVRSPEAVGLRSTRTSRRTVGRCSVRCSTISAAAAKGIPT